MNGVDNDQGKPPLSMLPDVLEEIAGVMAAGAEKHGRHNWLNHDWQLTQFYDAAQRHQLAWLRGEDFDPETGDPHLVHALANLMMLRHLSREGLGKDDRRKDPKAWVGFDAAGDGVFTWYDGQGQPQVHVHTVEPEIVWGPVTIVELPRWWRPWSRWRRRK